MKSFIRVVFVVGALACACASVALAQIPSDPCAQVTPAQVTKPTHQIVTLMYSPPGDWNSRKTSQMPGITKSHVSGIGDDAIAETLGSLTTLFVKKGNTTFMVRVYGVADPSKQLAIEKPIAQAVMAKV